MSGVEDEIRSLEDRRYRAVVDADIDTLDSLLHDRLSYSHSTGAVEGKAQMLQRVGTGYYDYRWIEHNISDVVVHRRTALVLQNMRAEVVVDGQLRQLSAASLAVWVRDQSWELLAYQPTPVPID